MTAFTIGLLIGGIIGIPIACHLAGKYTTRKEEQDGSKDLPDGTEDDEG